MPSYRNDHGNYGESILPPQLMFYLRTLSGSIGGPSEPENPNKVKYRAPAKMEVQ